MPEQNPNFTYDLESTDPMVLLISDIRSYIPDVDVEGGTENTFFTDVEIKAFYRRERQSIKRAAAAALEAIARDDALVLKMTRVLDISTDGISSARFILQTAADLRQQALSDEEEDATFEVVDFYPPSFFKIS